MGGEIDVPGIGNINPFSGGGGGSKDPRKLRGEGRAKFVAQARKAGGPTFDPPEETWAEYVAAVERGGSAGQAHGKPDIAGQTQSAFQESIARSNDLFRELQARREEQQREAERQAAFAEIDELLAGRTEAEQAAIRQVDADITQQLDRSRLLGLDFNVPDDRRLERISNLFSELFPEEQDTRLTTLMSRFGGPDMSQAERAAIEAGDLRFFPEFAIQRTDRQGDLSADEVIAPGQRATPGGRSGRRRGLLDEEEEAATLGANRRLGGR